MYRSGKLITLIVVLTFLVPVFVYGQSYYLDVRDIPGDVTDAGYEEQICITSFSWEVTRDVTTSGGGGGSASKAADFKVGKSFDLASPALYGAAANGRLFPEFIFTIVTPGGDGEARKLAVYELKKVSVTGYQPGGMADSVPKEVISIRAEEVKITHFEYNPDGSAGGERSFEWNFGANTGG